jgi:hypothetical protein
VPARSTLVGGANEPFQRGDRGNRSGRPRHLATHVERDRPYLSARPLRLLRNIDIGQGTE